MAMTSFIQSFPKPPPSGFITVCEKNAQLMACTPSDCQIKLPASYPELNAAVALTRASSSKESVRSAFVEVNNDSRKKQLLRAWYEHGLTGILDELTSSRFIEQSEGLRFFSKPAAFARWLVRWINSLHGSLFPHLALTNDDLITEFSQNPNWSDGYVRCFAWHPHVAEFAVAMNDDFIYIRSLEPCSIERTLKHKMQKGVADVAWKPLSSSILAVACQSCILIWKIDPLSLATNLWSNAVQLLSHTGHCPVISIAWSPQEGLLASASPTDNAILLWNVAMDSCLPIKRFGNGGVTLLRWSPDGSKLFSAYPSSVFRVWKCINWTSEKWTRLIGRCQNACWNPDGSTLLFTVANEPTMYRLGFVATMSDDKYQAKDVVAAINVTAVDLKMDDGYISVGGQVAEMVWDPNGERLAVSFTGLSGAFIAVFQTKVEPIFEVIPSGFIRGNVDERASIISFKPKFSGGSLLTVVWSSGRISHIPFYYTPRHLVGQMAKDDSNSSIAMHRTLFSNTM